MAVPFTKFITKKWAVLASKIDKLFIVIGITLSIKKRSPNKVGTAFLIM